jgi:hypothetical protein
VGQQKFHKKVGEGVLLVDHADHLLPLYLQCCTGGDGSGSREAHSAYSCERLIHPDRWLFIGPVRRIIGGFDLRESLHADGVYLGEPVLERNALDFILRIPIAENAFQGE